MATVSSWLELHETPKIDPPTLSLGGNDARIDLQIWIFLSLQALCHAQNLH